MRRLELEGQILEFWWKLEVLRGSDWWPVERNEQGRKDSLQISKADAKHAAECGT